MGTRLGLKTSSHYISSILRGTKFWQSLRAFRQKEYVIYLSRVKLEEFQEPDRLEPSFLATRHKPKLDCKVPKTARSPNIWAHSISQLHYNITLCLSFLRQRPLWTLFNLQAAKPALVPLSSPMTRWTCVNISFLFSVISGYPPPSELLVVYPHYGRW